MRLDHLIIHTTFRFGAYAGVVAFVTPVGVTATGDAFCAGTRVSNPGIPENGAITSEIRVGSVCQGRSPERLAR